MNKIFLATGTALGMSLLLLATLATTDTTEIAPLALANAADDSTPVFYRNEFYPGTEILAPNEMRVTALGTGNPEPRRSQASASFFVELGNGDKFFFDVGSGSQANFPMLRISYREADKVFLTHLHTDHAGDIPWLWIGGWVAGRYDKPLQVWGPSGSKREFGTAYFIEMQKNAWSWDLAMRHGKLPAAGGEIEVHEFNFAKTHVVYDENGVKIRSFPALHGMDGSVSYRLDWNGLSFGLFRRYDTNPVLCRQCGKCRLAHSRIYRHHSAHGRRLGLGRKNSKNCRRGDPHTTGGRWARLQSDQTSNGRCFPLFL